MLVRHRAQYKQHVCARKRVGVNVTWWSCYAGDVLWWRWRRCCVWWHVHYITRDTNNIDKIGCCWCCRYHGYRWRQPTLLGVTAVRLVCTYDVTVQTIYLRTNSYIYFTASLCRCRLSTGFRSSKIHEVSPTSNRPQIANFGFNFRPHFRRITAVNHFTTAVLLLPS